MPMETHIEWSGSGLPPAGCEIEYYSPSRGWRPGEYVGQFYGQMVVGCRETGVIGFCPVEIIRPVRTAAQIAREIRRSAINEMWARVSTDDAEHVAIQRKVCADLYDAGYRRVEGEA